MTLPGGTFTMGAPIDCAMSPNDPTCAWLGTPPVPGVEVAPFDLDRYEVTVARFRAFWSARSVDGGAATRSVPVRYPNGVSLAWTSTPQAPDMVMGCNWSLTPGTRESHPMNCIDWWMAQEFCAWDGGRLPTEAELEFASRGWSVPSEGLQSGRIYPWGDVPPEGNSGRVCDRAHINECAGEDGALTRRVGQFAATGGIYDLAGNVWEWAADRFLPVGSRSACWGSTINPFCSVSGPTGRAARSGSFSNIQEAVAFIRGASRTDHRETDRSTNIGFRCVRAAP
ncbi:MAG: SUMF1/EgtB/PvdO family nonheme iron enzyme [Phycisphaerales bacterium]|nr:SUMF1/EgtB/PvdO family nonheme iron enzyme [Phycisphaerales bacterium]